MRHTFPNTIKATLEKLKDTSNRECKNTSQMHGKLLDMAEQNAVMTTTGTDLEDTQEQTLSQNSQGI